MNLYVVASVVVALWASVAEGDSTERLIWSPLTLKSPYLTFLNDFYQPQWRTRHPMTKQALSLRHLQVPRGAPLALVCGACFHPSRSKKNLTVSVSGSGWKDDLYSSVAKTQGGQLEYHVGHLSCMMTYLITKPLEHGGKVTCTLHRGRQRKTEVISFGLVDIPVDNPDEQSVIQNDEEFVALECPKPPPSGAAENPVMFVWHDEEDPTGDAIPATRYAIRLPRPAHTRHITCSAYHIARHDDAASSKVYRIRYRVEGTQALTRQEYQHIYEVAGGDGGAEEHTNKKGISTTLLGILVTVGVTCLLLLVMGVHKLVSVARSP